MPPPKPTALVTGASAGIGAALARVLARRGYDLVLVARREAPLRELATALRDAHGVDTHVLTCDLADPAAASVLHDAVARRQINVDMLVNNAGFGLWGPFQSADLVVETRIIQVNVTALVALTKQFLPGMIARGSGCVLNVASTAAFVPGPNFSVYYASKAFVVSFSEALAEELRDTGVRVSTLCPGPTRTEFQDVARMRMTRLQQGVIMSAETVAEIGVAGALAGRRLVIPGFRNALVPWAARLLPRRIMTTLSRRAAEVG